MRNIFQVFVLVISALFMGNLSADTLPDTEGKSDVSVCEDLIASNAPEDVIAKSGCCSHHDGVCGCANGKTQCCDGTQSPSCTCNGNKMELVTPSL